MKTFIISDLHLSHPNAYVFTRSDNGERMRPWADEWCTADEMIIEAWNSIVSPQDKVYVLGDVSIKRKGLKLLPRMQGRKELILGNHDIFRDNDYTEHFNRMHGMLKKDKFILTHYPIHPDSIPHWCEANVHGHIHYKHVQCWDKERRIWTRDKRYINVSIEQLPDLKPLDFEEIKKGWPYI